MNKKNLTNKDPKRRIAIFIATFFPIFVWIYLKRYKKFLIWLAVITGFVIASVIERWLFKSVFFYFMTHLLGVALWAFAVTDALQFQGNKEKTDSELQ